MSLPAGNWREVNNTDDVRFGGNGKTNIGRVFEGGDNVAIDLPAGGALVLERIDRIATAGS